MPKPSRIPVRPDSSRPLSVFLTVGYNVRYMRSFRQDRTDRPSSMLAQALPWREEAIARLSYYLQGRIAAGEFRPHQPLIPIQLLTSSFLTLLLLEQPLEPVVEQLVDTIVEGIRVR